MTLPPCDAIHDTLPYRDAAYPATLDEIEDHFVARAPEATRQRRGLIMTAVRLHHARVTDLAARAGVAARVFLDGGFVTWKKQPPADADMAVLVPPAAYRRFIGPNALPLWTMSDFNATLGDSGGRVGAGILKPGFGLLDSYVAADLSASVDYWHDMWSAVRDPESRDTVDTVRKGYIEVVNR